ncbi:MAG: pseudouridine synthase [Vampirovibrionales bacterium]
MNDYAAPRRSLQSRSHAKSSRFEGSRWDAQHMGEENDQKLTPQEHARVKARVDAKEKAIQQALEAGLSEKDVDAFLHAVGIDDTSQKQALAQAMMKQVPKKKRVKVSTPPTKKKEILAPSLSPEEAKQERLLDLKAAKKVATRMADRLPLGQPVRLNKWLASTGRWSRREVDTLISAGRVKVNHVTVDTLGIKVRPGKDRIKVDNQVILPQEVQQQPITVLAFHKPKHVLSTRKDEKGRQTVYDCLPPKYRHLDLVGRLDRLSSGLLLMTNDGTLLHQLTHPHYHVPKTYWVEIKPHSMTSSHTSAPRHAMSEGASPLVYAESMTPLRKLPEVFHKGLFFEEEQQLAQAFMVERPALHTFVMELHTGLNRQIRRMFAMCGWEVTKLKRLSVGNITVHGLRPGAFKELSLKEVQTLMKATLQHNPTS